MKKSKPFPHLGFLMFAGHRVLFAGKSTLCLRCELSFWQFLRCPHTHFPRSSPALPPRCVFHAVICSKNMFRLEKYSKRCVFLWQYYLSLLKKLAKKISLLIILSFSYIIGLYLWLFFLSLKNSSRFFVWDAELVH